MGAYGDTRDRYSVTLLSIRQLNKKRKRYKNMANEIEKRNEAFLIYQDENGIARVNVLFAFLAFGVLM